MHASKCRFSAGVGTLDEASNSAGDLIRVNEQIIPSFDIVIREGICSPD